MPKVLTTPVTGLIGEKQWNPAYVGQGTGPQCRAVGQRAGKRRALRCFQRPRTPLLSNAGSTYPLNTVSTARRLMGDFSAAQSPEAPALVAGVTAGMGDSYAELLDA